jgi:ATP-dependent DNA ligase
VIFDLLSLEGVSLMRAPYSERRAAINKRREPAFV